MGNGEGRRLPLERPDRLKPKIGRKTIDRTKGSTGPQVLAYPVVHTLKHGIAEVTYLWASSPAHDRL